MSAQTRQVLEQMQGAWFDLKRLAQTLVELTEQVVVWNRQIETQIPPERSPTVPIVPNPVRNGPAEETHTEAEFSLYPPTVHTGRVELILGPMFSGKTTELLRRIRRHRLANQRVALIKYALDNRYDGSDDHAITHDRDREQVTASVHCLNQIQDAMLWDADVIGLDEGQFFPTLVEFCDTWANRGKIVVVAALDGTFERLPFYHRAQRATNSSSDSSSHTSVLDLIPKAESVIKLTSVCKHCGGDAAFTRRNDVSDTRTQVIGGSESYASTCRMCASRGSSHGQPVPVHATQAATNIRSRLEKQDISIHASTRYRTPFCRNVGVDETYMS